MMTELTQLLPLFALAVILASIAALFPVEPDGLMRPLSCASLEEGAAPEPIVPATQLYRTPGDSIPECPDCGGEMQLALHDGTHACEECWVATGAGVSPDWIRRVVARSIEATVKQLDHRDDLLSQRLDLASKRIENIDARVDLARANCALTRNSGELTLDEFRTAVETVAEVQKRIGL